MALCSIGTKFDSSKVVERQTIISKRDENGFDNFDQLKDLVPDMTDNTSVVRIADKAQFERAKKDTNTMKSSSYIKIKRKRQERHTLRRKMYLQRNIVKGLKAYLDNPRSTEMFNTATYVNYSKSMQIPQQSVEDVSHLEKLMLMSLAKTRSSGQTLVRGKTLARSL